MMITTTRTIGALRDESSAHISYATVFKWLVMDLVEALYREQSQLLISRQYDESSLNSPLQPGQLLESLKRNISICVHKADDEDEPFGFSLETTGVLRDAAEQVNIAIHYLFYPQEKELILYQLDMKWGAHQCTLHLNTSYHLPDAQTMFRRMERETQQAQHPGKPLRMIVPRASTRSRRR